MARADRDRGFYVGKLLDDQHAGPDDPRRARCEGDGERDYGVDLRGSECGCQRNRQEYAGEGHQPVHHPHHHIVGPADIARQRTYGDPKNARHHHHAHADA